MGTKNEAQRQELVAAIENGRCKTGRGSDYKIAIMVMVTLFIIAYIMAIMCPIIAALAIFGMVEYAKRNKSIAEKGYYIPATAQRFWVTRSKNSTTYHQSARYIEPSTKEVHEFHTTGPRMMKELVGTKVNTFINPDNTREYFMDTQSALRKLGFTTSREEDL